MATSLKKQLPESANLVLANLPAPFKKPVIVPSEMESDEAKITSDPKELLEQAQKLREKSAQLAWLLGVRLAKIHKLYDEGGYQFLDDGNAETWHDFCKSQLGLSYTIVANLIRFCHKVSWSEASSYQFEFSKALPLAAIESTEDRKELVDRIQNEGLTLREVETEVRLLKEKPSKKPEAEKKEKKPESVSPQFCVQIRMLGKEHVDSCQVARKGQQMIIKLELPEGESWPEEIIISPQKEE